MWRKAFDSMNLCAIGNENTHSTYFVYLHIVASVGA